MNVFDTPMDFAGLVIEDSGSGPWWHLDLFHFRSYRYIRYVFVTAFSGIS